MSPGSTKLAPEPASKAAEPGSRLATLPEGEPALTLGWIAAHWAESWLIQPNGPRAGQPFRLTRDQLRFLLWWYALDDQAHWLFHHAARRLAKGSGKSPFAAVLALIELCAPVRLERFDTRAPGGCLGRPVDMPWVQIAATAESQTVNTMRMVRAFAPKGSAVVEEFGLDPGKTKYYKQADGLLEIITSSFTAAEGAEATFVIGDESEHWKPANGGPDLAATLEDNLAKSGNRMLETANAWVPGEDCVAESTWDAWVMQELGMLQGESRILYDARIAPPDTDIEDEASLIAALEWVYGDCDWKLTEAGTVDVRPMLQRIWSPKSKPSESKRKYLNWPAAHEDAWTTTEAWSALADPTRVVEDGEDIVLFFDGSKSRDATALIACCVEDGHMFVPKTIDGRDTIWQPDPSHDSDDEVDVEDVDNAVDHVFETYRVLGFFGDVKEWESFVKITWPKRFADQLLVKAIPAGKDPQAIAWDMRSHTYDFTLAVELTEAEIDDQMFSHDGNALLAQHVKNMRRRPNRYGVSVGKESPDSPKKIDAGVCMIGARHVRRLVLAAGSQVKRTGVVWL